MYTEDDCKRLTGIRERRKPRAILRLFHLSLWSSLTAFSGIDVHFPMLPPLTNRFRNTLASHATRCTLFVFMVLVAVCFKASEALASEKISANPVIGRLNHAGFRSRAHCTGFTTTDGAVVTAAHCLPKIRTDIVHILLGYETGMLEHHLKIPAKSYRVVPERDIAVFCGHSDSDRGLHLVQTTLGSGTRVTVRGYGIPRGHILQKTNCLIASVPQKGFVMLDCGLPFGTSGAPVTVSGTENIIGVVSASSSSGALVSRLNASMLERFCH